MIPVVLVALQKCIKQIIGPNNGTNIKGNREKSAKLKERCVQITGKAH